MPKQVSEPPKWERPKPEPKLKKWLRNTDSRVILLVYTVESFNGILFQVFVVAVVGIANTEKSNSEEEGGTESVTYDHVCNTCSHVISQHKVHTVPVTESVTYESSVSDPYSLNPDPAKNLNPDPGKFFSPTKKFA